MAYDITYKINGFFIETSKIPKEHNPKDRSKFCKFQLTNGRWRHGLRHGRVVEDNYIYDYEYGVCRSILESGKYRYVIRIVGSGFRTEYEVVAENRNDNTKYIDQPISTNARGFNEKIQYTGRSDTTIHISSYSYSNLHPFKTTSGRCVFRDMVRINTTHYLLNGRIEKHY